jgi:hypothetical protein
VAREGRRALPVIYYEYMKERIPDYIPEGHLRHLPDYVPDSSLEEPSLPSAQKIVKSDSEKGHSFQSPEKETVKLTGNLAYAPKFDRLASGVPRARFTIGDHSVEGETTYHSAYATRQFAERIQKAGLERGQLVEVAGRWQIQQQKQDDGTVKEIKRFYAFGVRILGGQKP